MKYLPSLALALLVVTALRGVFTGVPVNFPALLLGAVVVCGIAWAVDKFYLAKRRAAGEVLHWGIEVPASIFTVPLGREASLTCAAAGGAEAESCARTSASGVHWVVGRGPLASSGSG